MMVQDKVKFCRKQARRQALKPAASRCIAKQKLAGNTDRHEQPTHGTELEQDFRAAASAANGIMTGM